MIVSQRHSFAFFRVPKTGSTTAEVMLRLSGAFTSDDLMASLPSIGLPAVGTRGFVDRPFVPGDSLAHMTPNQAIASKLVTEQELLACNCFAFVRDPIKRYLSAYVYTRKHAANVDDFRRYAVEGTPLAVLHGNQTDFFQIGTSGIVEALPCDNFDAILRSIVGWLGGFIGWEIPRFKASPYADYKSTPIAEWVDKETIRVLRARYAQDFELYESSRAKYADFETLSEGAKCDRIFRTRRCLPELSRA